MTRVFEWMHLECNEVMAVRLMMCFMLDRFFVPIFHPFDFLHVFLLSMCLGARPFVFVRNRDPDWRYAAGSIDPAGGVFWSRCSDSRRTRSGNGFDRQSARWIRWRPFSRDGLLGKLGRNDHRSWRGKSYAETVVESAESYNPYDKRQAHEGFTTHLLFLYSFTTDSQVSAGGKAATALRWICPVVAIVSSRREEAAGSQGGEEGKLQKRWNSLVNWTLSSLLAEASSVNSRSPQQPGNKTFRNSSRSSNLDAAGFAKAVVCSFHWVQLVTLHCVRGSSDTWSSALTWFCDRTRKLSKGCLPSLSPPTELLSGFLLSWSKTSPSVWYLWCILYPFERPIPFAIYWMTQTFVCTSCTSCTRSPSLSAREILDIWNKSNKRKRCCMGKYKIVLSALTEIRF